MAFTEADLTTLRTGTPGNYSPQAGVSPLLNRIPAGMAWGPFDMYGTAIDNTGLGAAGAYQ